MDTEQGTWTDCTACDGKGTVPVHFEDCYFPVAVGCSHCSGTGLGLWVGGDDDDGDTRRHDAPYDYQGGRAAA